MTNTPSAFDRMAPDVGAPEIWHLTPSIRWYRDLPQQPRRLQQMWMTLGGKREWRDIPDHVGEDDADK